MAVRNVNIPVLEKGAIWQDLPRIHLNWQTRSALTGTHTHSLGTKGVYLDLASTQYFILSYCIGSIDPESPDSKSARCQEPLRKLSYSCFKKKKLKNTN